MFKPPRPDYIDYLPNADPPDMPDGRIVDKEELAHLWGEAIRLVRPPLAQTLFQQQAILLAIEPPYFRVGIKHKVLLKLVQQRASKVEQAMSIVMDGPLKVTFSVLPKLNQAASQHICTICQQPLEQVRLQRGNRSGASSMLRCSADAAHPVYFETEPGCFANPGGVELLARRSPFYQSKKIFGYSSSSEFRILL